MQLAALLEMPSAPADFLSRTCVTNPATLIRQYAEYMLRSAGAWKLPVDIDQVIKHHGFKQPTGPLNAPLGRRGMLAGPAIIVNSDDAVTVQRFSKGHELVEALFTALADESPARFAPDVAEELWRSKERWCDWGAAELLLPADLFFPLLSRNRVKLALGCEWARDCQVSLTAMLRRMLEADVSPCLFLQVQERYIRWHGSANTPMLSQDVRWCSSSDLHVTKEWRSPQTSLFIKPNEVVEHDTSIYRTFHSNQFGKVEACNDLLDFDYIKGRQHTETVLVRIKGVPTVMTLIHPRNLC